MSSITATHSYDVRVLCSVIIIAQGYTRNIEYVTLRICFPVKLADRRMSIKKEKVAHLVYNIDSLS